MNDDLPQPRIEKTGRRGPSAAALVWLVPLVALVVAGWVGVRTLAERGPLVEITFSDASGIAPGETELRYRNVRVGLVETVRFTEGLGRVIVAARVDPEVAPYIDDDARFWVVQPEVTTRGIRGLNTVLSGVYIEGSWNAQADGPVDRIDGLDRAPLSAGGRDGLEIVLRTRREGGLSADTPILYKGVEVGRVGTPQISVDGTAVQAPAIIYDPHVDLITTATRFWDTSGFSLNIGPAGASLDFSSLASLVSGGIAFETIVSGGTAPQPGTRFEVFGSEAAARNSVFEPENVRNLALTLIFGGNVRGLETGAEVLFNGIRVGEVTNLTGLVDEDRFGTDRVRLAAVIDLDIGRLGLSVEADEEDALAFLSERVADGLRARLVTGNLLTGGLKVELVDLDDAPPAEIDLAALPFPIFPTTEANIRDVADTAEGVFRRINDLPIERLMDSAIDFLDAAGALARNDDLNATPADLRTILADVRAVTGSDDVQRLPSKVQGLVSGLRATADEADAAVTELRAILAAFRDADGARQIVDTLSAAESAASDVSTAVAGLPGLSAELEALAAEARGIPFAQLSARLDALLARSETLLGDEALARLPSEVSDTLAEARGVAADLRRLANAPEVRALPGEAGALIDELRTAVADLRATLVDLNRQDAVGRLLAATDAAAAAADNVGTSVEGVPALIEDLRGLVGQAGELPLEDLTVELTRSLQAVQRLLADAETRDLPAGLNRALAELQGALADLRQGGAIESANNAFAASEAAARSVADASADLPALISNANSLLGTASDVLTGVRPGSELSREARQALRELQRAAAAVASLARTLERQPNSILLGR